MSKQSLINYWTMIKKRNIVNKKTDWSVFII